MPPKKQRKSSTGHDKHSSPGPRQGEGHATSDKQSTEGNRSRNSRHSKRQQSSAKQYNQLTILLIGGAVLAIVAAIGYFWYSTVVRDIVRTPLQAPKITEMPVLSNQNNMERFWGTYRSGLYFGMKTRSPRSPVVGLMWMTQRPVINGMQQEPVIRHWCDQNDQLRSYGWMAHDGVNFGIQEIYDHDFTLTTDFVKRQGGNHGGEWSARFQIKPFKDGPPPQPVSLFIYIALDGEGQLSPLISNNRLQAIAGQTPGLGDFRLVFPNTGSSAIVNYLVGYTPNIAAINQIVSRSLTGYQIKQSEHNFQYMGLPGRQLPEAMPDSMSNFIVYQVTTFNFIPFELTVAFESDSMSSPREPLIGSVYTAELNHRYNEFVAQFDSAFPLAQHGYDEERIRFARAILSNMIGSIGYFYGSSAVRSRYNHEPIEYWPAALLTAVPSRSFFPRGFLWDEGFHQLLVSRWNESLSRDIIAHWLDLMNVEGWIPREQILGSEARARVPDEFVVQFNENANPPTLFLPLRRIVKNLISHNDHRDRQFLRALYPRLRSWYSWFNRTQAGKIPTSYRWRGRNATEVRELNPKTLTSGLDDYPRASHPTDDERHVDLRCWMAFASGVMADLAEALNESTARVYRLAHATLNDNQLLDELHWSEKLQRYSDYGLHTDSVKLKRPKQVNLKPGQQPPPPRDKERVVNRDPHIDFVDSSFGYVSLFPFLLRVLDPESPRLTQILSDLRNSKLLWTDFGLRSLAPSSPLYGTYNTEHDPPYWRGSIWININYLALSALHHYSSAADGTPNGAQALSVYKDLRRNVVDNIYQQYRLTGYIWEQYNDTTGIGKGSHPFTGWTALVVSIMAEDYY